MSRGAGSKEKKKKKLQKLKLKRDSKSDQAALGNEKTKFPELEFMEIPVSEVLHEIANSISSPSLRNWAGLVMLNWISLGMNWNLNSVKDSGKQAAEKKLKTPDFSSIWPHPNVNRKNGAERDATKSNNASMIMNLVQNQDAGDANFQKLVKALSTEKRKFKASVMSLVNDIASNEMGSVADMRQERLAFLEFFTKQFPMQYQSLEKMLVRELAEALFPPSSIDMLWDTFFSAQHDILLVYDEPDLRHVFQLFSMMELDCTVDDPLFRIDAEMISRIYAFVWNYLPQSNAPSLEFPDITATEEFQMIPEMITQSPLPSVQLYLLDHPHCCPAAFIERPTASIKELTMFLYADQRVLEAKLKPSIDNLLAPHKSVLETSAAAFPLLNDMKAEAEKTLAESLCSIFTGTDYSFWDVPFSSIGSKVQEHMRSQLQTLSHDPEAAVELVGQVSRKMPLLFIVAVQHIRRLKGTCFESLDSLISQDMREYLGSEIAAFEKASDSMQISTVNVEGPRLFGLISKSLMLLNGTEKSSQGSKLFHDWIANLPQLLNECGLGNLQAYFAYLEACRSLLVGSQLCVHRRICEEANSDPELKQRPEISEDVLQKYCDCIVSGLQALTVVFCRLVMRRYKQSNGFEVLEMPENCEIRWDSLGDSSPSCTAVSSASNENSDDGAKYASRESTLGASSENNWNSLSPMIGTTEAYYSRVVAESLSVDLDALLQSPELDAKQALDSLFKAICEKPHVSYEAEIDMADDPEVLNKLVKVQRLRNQQLEIENKVISGMCKSLQHSNDQYRQLSVKIRQYLSSSSKVLD